MLLMKYDSRGYVETSVPNEPLFAFCGIADPQSFFKSIFMLGINIQDKIIYKDHQNYNKTVINQLSQQIKKNNGIKVITTEKDLVKLPDSFLEEFEVYVIQIDVIFKHESIIKDTIKTLKINANDVGSSEVQIGLLSDKISNLSSHFQKNKNDKHSTQGLLKAVNRRKRLLEYLKRKNPDSYAKILTQLNLRK